MTVEADAITSEEDGIRWARDRGWRVLVAIGDNRRRLSLVERLIGGGLTLTLPSFVATTATVAYDAELDAGTIALEHAHIGPGARLGTATVVNTGAVVEHEVLGAGCHVAPHATLSVGVQVGSGVLGAGATVLPGVSVGEWSVVGSGSVVVHPVPAHSVVTGAPARLRPPGSTDVPGPSQG